MRVRVLAAVWLCLGCGQAASPPPHFAAPAQARAVLVLDPPVVAVGEMADLELAVVTPPGQEVRPPELPDRVPGFWLVEREPPETVKEPSRWVHRTRLRLRAIEVGRFEFPGGSVEVGSPEAGTKELHYDPLPLEVTSTLAAHPGRGTPYGVRTLPLRDALRGGRLTAFAAGAILALAGMGLLLLARRRLSAREPGALLPAPGRPPAWQTARERLAAARRLASDEPRRALDLAACGLRGFAVDRFGGDATVRTTEELAVAEPPFTMTTRWARFTALLSELDAARFPAEVAEAARVHELLADVASFVEDCVPREMRTRDEAQG